MPPPTIRAGDRAVVAADDRHPERQGAVRYVGDTIFSPGTWAGLELDEPLGKNDGAVQGYLRRGCRPADRRPVL